MDTQTARRTASINIASAPSSQQCHDCGARHIGMCDALTDESLELLARVAQRMTVAPGKEFIEETQPAVHFYNVNAGTVRVSKSLPDGRRHIIGFMSAGQFLGLGVSGQYAFSAEALDEVRLCRFNRKSLTETFAELPAIERRLLDITAHELTIAQEQMLLLARKTAQERVASFLMDWAERVEPCARPDDSPKLGTLLVLPMRRGDLADYLGLTVETVARTFSALKRDGLIQIDQPNEIRLLKPAVLASIANAF